MISYNTEYSLMKDICVFRLKRNDNSDIWSRGNVSTDLREGESICEVSVKLEFRCQRTSIFNIDNSICALSQMHLPEIHTSWAKSCIYS